MSSKPVPRILITNDDGIQAEGLKVLEQIANELSDEVWVVAPEHDQSGTSHSVSLQDPLRLYSWSDRRHSVRGTPSDCVLLAVEHLMKECRPSLILSGVNRGHNLSDAVAYSGTVGAAMTGLLLNVPAIALSQAFRVPEGVRWDTAARLAPPLILALLERGWPRDVCLNINFPDVDADQVRGVSLTRPARGLLAGVEIDARLDSRAQQYFWLRFRHGDLTDAEEDSDVMAVRQGRISISPLRFARDTAPDCHELGVGLSEFLKGA